MISDVLSDAAENIREYLQKMPDVYQGDVRRHVVRVLTEMEALRICLDTPPFPLGQWFDLTKPISRDDREIAEAQMAVYAIKQGLEPEGAEWRQAVAELRAAARAHNRAFHAC